MRLQADIDCLIYMTFQGRVQEFDLGGHQFYIELTIKDTCGVGFHAHKNVNT